MTTFKTTFIFFSTFVLSLIFVGFMVIMSSTQETSAPAVAAPKATHRASLIMIGREVYSGYASASPEMSWAACLEAKQNFNDLLGRGARGYVCLDLETGDIAH